VREHDDSFEVDIDLPGFTKDEIEINLRSGYLTVSAAKGLDKDNKDPQGKLIRQERYAGAMQRSYYVGKELTEEDIKAKFENGVLSLYVPKKEPQKALPETKRIAIE
jgi:HSP20 family molecular chaperone IbpA